MDTKVAIALPTNRGLRPKCMQSLLDMLAYKDFNFEIFIATEGFNTAENRTWLAVQATKADCTHVLFVDDDMIYEKDTVEKLLKADKEIVGARYANRRGSGEVVEYDGEQSETEPFKVKAVGGGCLMVKTEVFKNVPQPWFWYKINPNGSVAMSNDWYFCEQARMHAFDIWCEPTVKPGHIQAHLY